MIVCVMFAFGEWHYSIEFYILLPLFFYVFRSLFALESPYASRCFHNLRWLRDQFEYSSMLCWTSISNRYTYCLSLIKGSSNFSIGLFALRFRFHFRFRLRWFCLLFDARSIGQSQYKLSHVMNWWLCERMRHFDEPANEARLCACVCVCMQ